MLIHHDSVINTRFIGRITEHEGKSNPTESQGNFRNLVYTGLDIFHNMSGIGFIFLSWTSKYFSKKYAI